MKDIMIMQLKDEKDNMQEQVYSYLKFCLTGIYIHTKDTDNY